jgi:hypothetical protein
MRCLIVLLALVALAFAQTPSPPSWPTQFSSSILAYDTMGNVNFLRWFYSQTLNKDRLDGPVMWNNEMYFAERIFDHTVNMEYNVYMQQDVAVCFSHAINSTIPKPNLSSMTFIGKALLGFDAAYHWFSQDTATNTTFQYYDSQSTREPLRIDFAYGSTFAGTWLWWEFDGGAQDSNLYSLPSAILAQCNSQFRRK